MEKGIGRYGAKGGYACRSELRDGRRYNASIFIAKLPVLTGVRVETAYRNAWVVIAEILPERLRKKHSFAENRVAIECSRHLVQGHVNGDRYNAEFIAGQHHCGGARPLFTQCCKELRMAR